MDGQADLRRSRKRSTRAAIARGDRSEMLRRRDAAQATLDKFGGKPQRLGSRDCVRMTAHHLRLLGHAVPLPAAGSYRTVAAARRQLADRGFADLAAAVDAFLPRRVPAAAVVGDVVFYESADGLGALAIVLGNGRVLGFLENGPAAVLQPLKPPLQAWRVTPCPVS